MGVHGFANLSLAYADAYESRADAALRIDGQGRMYHAPELHADLNPKDLNKSVAPVAESRVYADGHIALYNDNHFFVARWSPARTTPEAIERLVDLVGWLLPGHPILFCYDVGGWCIERYFTPEFAIKRIRELTDARSCLPARTTHVEQLDPAAASEGPPFLSLAWSLWQQMTAFRERHDGHAFWDLAHSHAVWVNADDDSDLLGMSYVGPRAPIRRHYNESWFQRCFSQSKSWTGHQDRHETRVSKDYETVARSGVPRLDDVVGSLDQENGQRIWLRYRRLILPVPVTDTIPALFVFSELQPNTPFPFFREKRTAAAQGRV